VAKMIISTTIPSELPQTSTPNFWNKVNSALSAGAEVKLF